MVRHQKKCKSCGAPEEYIEDVEYRHKGQTVKTPRCSICGAYAGPKIWLKPIIMAKTEKYLEIKEEQAKVLMRAIKLLGVKPTHARMRKGLCIPFAHPKDAT